MECKEAQVLIQAHLDRELDLVRTLEVERHLQDCPHCWKTERNYQALRSALNTSGLRFEPSADFQKRIRASIRQESRDTVRHPWLSWNWLGAGAALAVVALIVWSTLPGLKIPSEEDSLSKEIAANHVRSLMVDHLTDVGSSDQHTVKPWFNGKLDFSPSVADLASHGFPLIGGRLDYLGNRSVAALVYQRRQHMINLYEWPLSGQADRVEKVLTQRGYNLVHWCRSGMVYWAVSDLNQKELREFVELIQTSN